MSNQIHSSPTGDVMCCEQTLADDAATAASNDPFPRVFPPADSDAQTRRSWLASSPWPEVVFASAG